jgi:predicted porin
MKKSLFAIAAVTAFAGAAQAQSSVTVYGILDVGYIGSNAREGTTKIQRSAFGQNAETTSRLGFRGTESLGGGMDAFFTVEFGLTPNNANLSGGGAADAFQSTAQGGGTAIDNRQSFVGLRQKGIGQFAIGRQYTPVFVAGAATSAGQYNNVVGDVVYGGASSVWAATTSTVQGNNNGIGYTNRASNAITVQSDRFGGLVVSAMYAMNNQDRTATGGPGGAGTAGTQNTNWNMSGIGADFRWKKLIVTAAYQAFNTDYDTGAAAGTAPVVVALGGAGVAPGANLAAFAGLARAQIKDNQMLAGAVYDFGIVKAYAQYTQRKLDQGLGENLNRNAQQIGVRGNWTPKIESWASVGNGSVKSAVNGVTANFTGYQLGTNYILSKRTNAYGIFGSTTTSSTSGVGSLPGGASANQYAVGVRHTF